MLAGGLKRGITKNLLKSFEHVKDNIKTKKKKLDSDKNYQEMLNKNEIILMLLMFIGVYERRLEYF